MIRLERVIKTYDRPVLRGVTLQVPRGCLFGLVGPAAAGKTVLLKIVTGLVRADSGRIVVRDRNVAAMGDLELARFRLEVGMQFQNNALFDYLTVAENIAFPLRRLGALPESEITRRVAERLDRVRLPGFETRMPAGLSGGQRRRVGIARATIAGAPLVIYDEPAAGLDPVTSQKIFNLLREEQRASAATVVMVSSDLDRLFTVTDRVGMMYRGRLIFEGTTTQALESADPFVHQFMHGLPDGPL
ncbi:MAG: ATP-binding cassette domain-containing protein [Polyangiaceae bacterium]|nr:ATP-binding cassette domain-containing protein [Polyangiaceae bacterium]